LKVGGHVWHNSVRGTTQEPFQQTLVQNVFETVLYYILLLGHIESNPGPNIVSGKPNLKNGSLKIAHINACSLLPKIDLIE
jgi:hypothetical protein